MKLLGKLFNPKKTKKERVKKNFNKAFERERQAQSLKGKLRTMERNAWLSSKGYTPEVVKKSEKNHLKKPSNHSLRIKAFKKHVKKLTGYESINDSRIPNSKRGQYRKEAKRLACL